MTKGECPECQAVVLEEPCGCGTPTCRVVIRKDMERGEPGPPHSCARELRMRLEELEERVRRVEERGVEERT